jgi:hypothetical protein
MPYSVLDSHHIIASLETLSKRIYERFPDSGLYQVSVQLLALARDAQEDSNWVARPIVLLRAVTVILVLVFVLIIAWTLRSVDLPEQAPRLVELVQLIEAGINDVILFSAGIFFLVSAETRIKRRRALSSLHRLRAFAHIIDMHQLLKDPERVLYRGELTPSTPKIRMTPFELSRYLDYCSELLSLTGIIAGLYAQSSGDAVVVDAVSEIENLTNGVSRKIWQKLMIMQLLESTTG